MAVLKAIIFDMDGLLINSEPLWRRAEVKVLNRLGVPIVEDDCIRTMGLREDEAVAYWFNKFPWAGMTIQDVAAEISNRVIDLVKNEGAPMPGVMHALDVAEQLGVKIAIASSSGINLINTVVSSLRLEKYIDHIYSAMDEAFGKPHPAVYINAASRLGVDPTSCLAIEDSVNGVISAKAAKMKCVAVPEPSVKNNKEFAVADKVINSLEEVSASLVLNIFNQA